LKRLELLDEEKTAAKSR